MTTTHWVLAVAGHSPPLVDIDATVLVQLGIFLILLVALNQLVFRPYLALRAERARNIEGVREEALRLGNETESKLASYEEQMGRTRKEAAAVRQQLRQQGDAKGTEILSGAQKQAEVQLAAAREKIEKSTQAAELSLRTRADVLANAAARKVLGREV